MSCKEWLGVGVLRGRTKFLLILLWAIVLVSATAIAVMHIPQWADDALPQMV